MAKLGRWLLAFGMLAAAVSCSGASDDGTGEPEHCTTKHECSAGVCDPTTGTCVECLRSEDCRGDAACKERKCVPRLRCENTFDCPENQVCGRSEGYCAQCFRDADCADGGCVNEVCRPHCDSDKDCVELDQLCDFARSLCVDCVADSDCEKSEYCGNGVCQPDVCTATVAVCSPDGTGVSRCTANGSSEVSEPCGADARCVETGDAPECAPLVCSPGSLSCDADATHVVECSEDGLALEAVEDCAEDDEVCIAGACSAPPCDAGETVCMGRNIFVCNATGTDLELSGICGEGAYCDPETGDCVVGKCTPGETICAEGGVAICNASGSGFADAVPCGEDEGCLMGACALVVCEPSTKFCTAGHLFLCNDTGTTFEIAQTCGLDQYCDEDTAKCEQRVCEPGAQFCGDDGNARKCNSLGNGSSVNTTCTDSQVCEMKGGTASCVSGEGGAGGDGG